MQIFQRSQKFFITAPFLCIFEAIYFQFVAGGGLRCVKRKNKQRKNAPKHDKNWKKMFSIIVVN